MLKFNHKKINYLRIHWNGPVRMYLQTQNTVEKNAANVTIHSLWHVIWDTLEYIHLGTTKPMHPVQPCILLGRRSEDSFEIAPWKKKTIRLASLIHYACSNSSIFRTHLKTFSEHKLNKCNQCNFACFGQGALSTHLKTHSGERSNKCNQCYFAFHQVREGVKYYFADFVRKWGGVPPKSVTPFSVKKKNP